jgi:anti-sigma B factor antagonist
LLKFRFAVDKANSEAKICPMRDEPLTIDDLGLQNQARVLRLSGPLTISTLYQFQDLVRINSSANLTLDFTRVPYVDSAGVGALVGAYVRHQKEGHSVTLAGVNERVRNTLKVTQVENFFTYTDSVPQVA